MALCWSRAESSPDASKILSSYLDCNDVFAARCTCHSIELLPRSHTTLLSGERCFCFWQSPEWLCTLINKSTKEPNTVLRWPIARACDNLVGPRYPPHTWAFDIALRRRLTYGTQPGKRIPNGFSTGQLPTSSELTDSLWPSIHGDARERVLECLEFQAEIAEWLSLGARPVYARYAKPLNWPLVQSITD